MSSPARLAAQILALALISTAVSAQEWTRFRGPNGAGVSSATTIPAQFSDGDFNWKVELPGQGHSSPVLWGKKIFVTSADEVAGKRFMLCLDAKDGSKLWSKTESFAGYHHHEFNNCASSTPTVDKDHVYFLWGTPDNVTIQALDHAGTDVWKKDLGKLGIAHGIGTSPIVVGDVLIVGIYQEEKGLDGFLVGMNRKTGDILWKKPRDQGAAYAYSTPMVYQPTGGPTEVIFTSTPHGITSVNPKTGEINWEVPNVFTARCVGGPIFAKGLIIATAGVGDGTKQAVAVRPADKKAGKPAEVAYKAARGYSYVPTPVAFGDLVFYWGDAGIVTCVKAESGEQVWQERVDGKFFGSPVCIAGKLYAISTTGDVFIIEASDKFRQLGRVPLGEISHATPAVADGKMYLRTASHLISVGGAR